MDPATIGLFISIAPTLLDMLFGQDHIKKSLRHQNYPDNMYGYSLEGYGMLGEGYRYPRRRREVSVKTYYSPDEKKFDSAIFFLLTQLSPFNNKKIIVYSIF
jgi:hypothetical protein